ncbi:hypothetical protein [Atopobium fossor]|uniref:hypothetical protein n=1 Tax=Atopobium fossor TaxID=39487 RepID=UPI0003F88F94|nr:hypothetical protein [Atopobium fossor]
MSNKLTPFERLYIEQAVYKAIASDVSTKGAGLRAQLDAALIDGYLSTGVKSRDALIQGQKVGAYSVKVSKDTRKTVLSIQDRKAWLDWALENGYAHEEKHIVVDDEQEVLAELLNNGELPDGCEVQEVGTPPRPTGTTLTVDPAKVNAIMGELGMGNVFPLLDGEK